MKNFLKRIKEPSTWAGLAALSILFGVNPDTANVVVQAVGAVAGAVAVLMPEKAA
jgi:ABC-type uncharacterized transport system permease subunit